MNDQTAEAIPAAPTAEHIDPVCGMTVDPAEAAGSSAYRGQTYYFCHPSCLERFEAAPEHSWPVTASEAGAQRHARRARSYICPMDPRCVRPSPARARSAAWRSSRICPIRRR